MYDSCAKGKQLWETMERNRDAKSQKAFEGRQKLDSEKLTTHVQSEKLIEHMYKSQTDELKDALRQWNLLREGLSGVKSRIMILLDGTGSMADLLQGCKQQDSHSFGILSVIIL